MSFHRFWLFLATPFRRKRMTWFLDVHRPTKQTRILDVGGTLINWQLADYTGRVVLLNLSPPPRTGALAGYDFVQGDGRALPYPDDAFDIAFSNSVIEHLPYPADQAQFAAELRRVAPALWVQTPAKSFLIDAHLLTPFIHFLPEPIVKRLARNFTLWGLMTRPSNEQAARTIESIRLLTYDDMRRLFPDCRILRERVLGLTKSYIAVRP